jgi:hypothetical protein
LELGLERVLQVPHLLLLAAHGVEVEHFTFVLTFDADEIDERESLPHLSSRERDEILVEPSFHRREVDDHVEKISPSALSAAAAWRLPARDARPR